MILLLKILIGIFAFLTIVCLGGVVYLHKKGGSGCEGYQNAVFAKVLARGTLIFAFVSAICGLFLYTVS